VTPLEWLKERDQLRAQLATVTRERDEARATAGAAMYWVAAGERNGFRAALADTEENVDVVARVIPELVGQGTYVRVCARLVLETLRARAESLKDAYAWVADKEPG
jgi:hypothetical protein